MQILSGIHFTTLFIDFFVVETKRFVGSLVNNLQKPVHEPVCLIEWKLTAKSNLYLVGEAISTHQIVNLSRRPKPIRHTRHGGTPFGGWGCVLYRAWVSPVMRASPSTCRVLTVTIDWQVRGLCRCLWYARRGLCLFPCVTTPRGCNSLPTGVRVLFQQTNKQTNREQHSSGELHVVVPEFESQSLLVKKPWIPSQDVLFRQLTVWVKH